MSLAPLLAASPWVQLHAAAATAALGFGVVQLMRRKGGRLHRVLGYGFVVAMTSAAATSFLVHEIRQWHGFSLIHLLSIFTLAAMPLIVLAARRGHIARHRQGMLLLFWTGLVIPGLLTLLPGRILGRVVFGG